MKRFVFFALLLSVALGMYATSFSSGMDVKPPGTSFIINQQNDNNNSGTVAVWDYAIQPTTTIVVHAEAKAEIKTITQAPEVAYNLKISVVNSQVSYTLQGSLLTNARHTHCWQNCLTALKNQTAKDTEVVLIGD